MKLMVPIEAQINQKAHELGFELSGIAAATPADGFDRMRDWLDQGFAGEMGYMHNQAEARRHPSSILPEVRSVVMVGMNYLGEDNPSADSAAMLGQGRIARYARGQDYHDVLR